MSDAYKVDEAKEALEGLKRARELISIRETYYNNNITQGLIPNESLHLAKLESAHTLQTIGQGCETAASFAHLIPDFDLGAEGAASSPVVKAIFGGSNIASALQAFSRIFSLGAATETHQGTMASIQAGFDRRLAEWELQKSLATKEKEQIDKQIAAAEIRLAIAEKELQNHDLQVENAKEVDEFMRSKFTNHELYNWMVTQISGIYFQSYQLAYDVAKRAERCYRFELGLTDSNFIRFGYWDSLKKGLLSGEKLHQDLKRMEMAYLDQNKREYEITKHVSLVLHDSLALIALKETGQCEIFLPETLFDADYPGHFMRRTKSVSLTLPCVVGPYTSINCTLTLLSNKTRIKTTTADPYPENLEEEDKRFVTNFAAMQSIATSHAQNDSGLFELNFRDERYLPFEGAGVISRWRIELPKETNAFDLNTLSDVILHLKYTAREGGEILKKEAKKAVQDTIADEEIAPLARLFSLKHEFPSEWHRFLSPIDTDKKQALSLDLTPERFPFMFRRKKIEIKTANLFLKPKEGLEYKDVEPLVFDLKKEGGTEFLAKKFLMAGSPIEGLPYNEPFNGQSVEVKEGDKWFFEVERTDIPESLRQKDKDGKDVVVEINGQKYFRLNPDAIKDIFLVCHYSVG